MNQTSFKSRVGVLTWLQENGWQVSRSGFYKHFREGKLRPEQDGTFTLTAVEKYAKTFLKRASTGKKVRVAIDDLLRKKAGLEVRSLEIKTAREEFKRGIEEGKYIPRDQLELELAARAAVLDAGLTHLFQSQAGALIEVASGDPRKTAEVVHRLIAEKDRFLNQYAAPIEFTVEIAGEDEADV